AKQSIARHMRMDGLLRRYAPRNDRIGTSGWLLGIPLPILVLIYAFGGLNH
ncbi:MAG: hypothetical protein H0T83_08505, partial [Chthoniobacterales bacterium]|nr:hypothetical protein [Chthoniobacterales bacterium]